MCLASSVTLFCHVVRLKTSSVVMWNAHMLSKTYIYAIGRMRHLESGPSRKPADSVAYQPHVDRERDHNAASL